MSPPSLSVVVVTVESAARLRGCLDALTRQPGGAEILVPWDGSHGDSASLKRDYPAVRFLPLAGGRRTFAQLRACGVAGAGGDVIATTEDHCTPEPDWCRQIVDAHRAPHPAIGGAVEKQTPDSALNWAFYLADYLRYAAPREGPSLSLTDGNVSYKRSALDAIRPVWEIEFHEDVVHAALTTDGRPLWLSPRIVVRQKRAVTLRQAIRDRYAFGRLFGSTRVQRLHAAARLKLTVACILVPPLLLLRIARQVARTRQYASAALRASPALLLISTVWAWGEFLGYVTGRPGRSLTARAS